MYVSVTSTTMGIGNGRQDMKRTTKRNRVQQYKDDKICIDIFIDIHSNI